jgi:hypothetical protein
MPAFVLCKEMKDQRDISMADSTYLVTDAGAPVSAFTPRANCKPLRRRLDTFASPLFYKFRGDGWTPAIITPSATWPMGDRA